MSLTYDIANHEVLKSEEAFKGKVIRVFLEDVRLPDGKVARWERVVHPGAVGMVPLFEDLTVLMVRQYRHAVRGPLLEIPAGKLDPGESPENCAQRELAEETEYTSKCIEKLAEFYNSPGYSDEKFYLYLVRDLEPTESKCEADEFLIPERLPLDNLFSMIARGEIRDAKTIIGLTLTRFFLEGKYKPSL
ncbi:MAG: NUDIX hydrolase [Actinomycetota bacterium]|nr:NUDIX hydrolase [Actinomycetota bacterium]